MITVLVAHDDPEPFRADLEARFPQLRFVYATSPEAVPEALAAHAPEVAFSVKHSGFPGPAHRLIVQHRSIRWVHVGGSGYDHLQPWDRMRVTVTNSVGILSRFLAETTTGAMLALNCGLVGYLAQQRERVWQPRPFPPLAEQTLLVVGLGHIGLHVAANAKALGMEVIAVRRSGEPQPSVDEVHPPPALLDLLPRADVVSVHVPHNEETTHLIDAAALAAMKPDALLLNTARGAVVDEAALVRALAAGRLRGAYLDVFEVEPLPTSSPLWAMPNVLVTPHAADNVTAWPSRFARLFADNLERWLAGEPLVNVVLPVGAG
jgi:phosphoglycerate dehydrogenase-like enzyme